MHPKSISAIRKKLKGTLLNLQIEGGQILYQLSKPHLRSLADEVLKQKKSWIDRDDVLYIFLMHVLNALGLSNIRKIENKITAWDLLGEDLAEKLVETITLFYSSIPRRYDVYIPLKRLTGNFRSQLLEEDTWGLVSFKDEDSLPVGITPKQLEMGTVYLCLKSEGYLGSRFDSITSRAVLSNFKVIMQLGIIDDIFALDEDVSKTRLAEHFQIPKIYITACDHSASPPNLLRIQMSLDISDFINKLNYSYNNRDKHQMLRFRTANAIPDEVELVLKPLCKILSSTSDPAKRIKSSIQWYFDSFTTKSPTLSFLQICIGLEAILGDDISSGILTETLADRCSYLIARNIEERKVVKENFKDLYHIRSKIVHGCLTELNQGEQIHLTLGRKMLSEAIIQEIEHLE